MIKNLYLHKQIIQIPLETSRALSIYVSLFDQKLLINPIIFTDRIYVTLKTNIPIFHTSFMRSTHIDDIIIMDYDDYKISRQYLANNSKIIVLHDQISYWENDDIKNNTNNRISFYNVNTNELAIEAYLEKVIHNEKL